MTRTAPEDGASSTTSRSIGGNRLSARVLPLLIGLGLSALFLWLALREVDFQELSTTLAGALRWPLLPFAAALLGCFWLKAIRWRWLIRAEHGVRTAQLVDPMMMGFAANNVFPLRAGELVRVFVAGKSLGISRTELLASLVVERVLDALSVAIITAGALIAVRLQAETNRQLLVAAAVALLAAAAVLMLLYRIVGSDPSRLARRLPLRIRKHAAAFMTNFTAGLEPIVSGRMLAMALASSLAQWLLLAFCVFVSMVAVGIEPSLPVAMIVLGLVVLGISIPSGPAYIGNIEYAFVLGLGLFGVEAGPALAAAIFYHAMMLVSVTGTGTVCWVRHARGPRGHRSSG